MARYDFIAVYMMASKRNGTIYTGVTSDLPLRAHLHRDGKVEGFTQKYGCKLLVWYERYATLPPAIQRETRIKGWRRAWKLALIGQANPEWEDLYPTLI